MESLLRWSISHTDPNAAPPDPARLKQLDPAIIDQILGKPDAVLMKESLEKALDKSQSEDDRVAALDDFEMLIESLDNANNLTPLQMWSPLINLLQTTDSDAIRTAVLWILGTAVQNNPTAQKAFLSYNPIPLVVSCLDAETSTDAATRSKALYTLSSTLRHSKAALETFTANKGWKVLQAALTDSDLTVRRKAAFLISSLLLRTTQETDLPSAQFPGDAPVDEEGLKTSSLTKKMVEGPDSGPTIVSTIVDELRKLTPFGPNGDGLDDTELKEKLAKCIVCYLEAGGELDGRQGNAVREALRGEDTTRLGLDEGEWNKLVVASQGTS